MHSALLVLLFCPQAGRLSSFLQDLVSCCPRTEVVTGRFCRICRVGWSTVLIMIKWVRRKTKRARLEIPCFVEWTLWAASIWSRCQWVLLQLLFLPRCQPQHESLARRAVEEVTDVNLDITSIEGLYTQSVSACICLIMSREARSNRVILPSRLCK